MSYMYAEGAQEIKEFPDMGVKFIDGSNGGKKGVTLVSGDVITSGCAGRIAGDDTGASADPAFCASADPAFCTIWNGVMSRVLGVVSGGITPKAAKGANAWLADSPIGF